MHYSSPLLAAVIVVIVALPHSCFAQPKSAPIKRGVVFNGELYVAGTISKDRESPLGDGTLLIYRAKLGDAEKPSRHNISVVIAWHGGNTAVRWHFGEKSFWVAQFWPVVGDEGRLVEIPARDIASFRSPEKAWVSAKEKRAYHHVHERARLEPYRTGEGAYFDFHAHSDETCSLFIACCNRVERWELNVKPPKGNRREEDWNLKKSWKTDCEEPFYVYVKGTTYFFITESGKVYAADESSKETKQIWDGAKRLEALVIDKSRGKAFGFGNDFFFEIKKDLSPRRCPELIRPDPDLNGVFRTTMDCWRFLVMREES